MCWNPGRRSEPFKYLGHASVDRCGDRAGQPRTSAKISALDGDYLAYLWQHPQRACKRNTFRHTNAMAGNRIKIIRQGFFVGVKTVNCPDAIPGSAGIDDQNPGAVLKIGDQIGGGTETFNHIECTTQSGQLLRHKPPRRIVACVQVSNPDHQWESGVSHG